MTSHASLVRSLELRLDWEDVVNELMVPQTKRDLTLDTAMWFVTKGHTCNRLDVHYVKALSITDEYLTIANQRAY